MGVPRDFTFDRKGPCPICDRAFSACKHSYVEVEEHLREKAVRRVVQDELKRLTQGAR